MVEQRNIVILGASFAGITSAQYIIKHILPSLNATHDAKYHLYVLNPSADFYFRIAAPRTGTANSLLPADKIFVPFSEIFKSFPKNDFTFIQAAASSLNTTDRTVTYHRSEYLQDESLSYHALVVATGSRTHHPAFSANTSTDETMNALKKLETQVSKAKDIVVVGGGPTGVETAAEIGEYLNGKPGWFSTPARKVNTTLITSDDQLLPSLRPAIGKQAERKLKALGVDVIYNTRVADASPSKNGSKTIVTLANGEKLQADLYVPAHGVLPNSEYLPSPLLDSKGYIQTNPSTLRVDLAGPRVYALGDISSASRNKVIDLAEMLPVFYVNLKRDLVSYNPAYPNEPAPGKDRVYKPIMKEMLGVVVGSGGGVGAVYGWKIPSWVVWLMKSRDMMVGMSLVPLVAGKQVEKEVKWTAEEAVA